MADGSPAAVITGTVSHRNPHYHGVTDSPGILAYRRMEDSVRGVLVGVLDLEGRPVESAEGEDGGTTEGARQRP
jgi:hypothetical protein